MRSRVGIPAVHGREEVKSGSTMSTGGGDVRPAVDEHLRRGDAIMATTSGGREGVGLFVLVRHAHAGDKTRWRGADADRALSMLGHQQARSLVTALRGIELHTLFSSPTARCRDTLIPLAVARDLPIQDHPLLAPNASGDELFAALRTSDIDGILWCTHGEILDALAALARANGSTGVPAAPTTAKGGAWIVDRSARRSERLRYIAPVPGDVTEIDLSAP